MSIVEMLSSRIQYSMYKACGISVREASQSAREFDGAEVSEPGLILGLMFWPEA
jgi:hypothetical protein